MNFYKLGQILRGRKHCIWAYLSRRHRIKSRLESKYSVRCLILGYVLPFSFDTLASSSRYTGHWMSRIGRASCCIGLTSLFIPTEFTEGSSPLHKLLTKQTGQVASPEPKLCCLAPAQLSSELSRSSGNSLSGQAAEQAGEQARLDFPLYCSHIHCKRNPLQQTPLFRKGSL